MVGCAAAYAALNRHEMPPTAPDCVNIDHRRETAFGPDDLTAYQNAGLELDQGINIYVEEVHQLNGRGAVITYAAHETSQQGFDAEWRGVAVFLVDGDRISRCEVFDEADLDAAVARFDELQPRARQLENTASRVAGRVWACFVAHDWEAVAELFADDISTDDRRRVVNSGVLRGRDAQIANMRALTELATDMTSTVIATRGERLALNRICSSSAEDFSAEWLSIIEIGADNRAVAGVQFDADDLDAAFEELDARYLAGEAAAYAHVWSVITGGQAAYNRQELPPTTEGWVNVDHRRGRAFAPGDMMPYLRATYDVAPNVKGHIEAVHRLSNLGAVITEIVTGTSQEGFAFEWRESALFAFEGDMVCRFELFDEADLDAALARFDELNLPAPQLETRQAGQPSAS